MDPFPRGAGRGRSPWWHPPVAIRQRLARRRESPMLFGKRESRSLVARRRGTFRPKPDWLEERTLLPIHLGGGAPPVNPNANDPQPAIATTPFGVDFAGGISGLGAGFS